MKKIIGLSLISSIVATPLLTLTSCGTNYVEPIPMYNMLDETTWPEVQPIHISERKSQAEMADLYIQNVVSDKSIFAKDMVRGAKTYVDKFNNVFDDEDNVKLTKFDLGFSTPTFDTTTITHISAIDETLNTVSFKQRINLTYELGNDADPVHYVQNISVDVDYQNVIFAIYEDVTSSVEPWCISLLDDNIGDESFWYYQFDAEPWSVSYSCTNERTKIIKGSEGRPDVTINDTEYYSGMIDDVYKLYNTYSYIMDKPEEETYQEKGNRLLLSMVLLLDYKSQLLKNVDRQTDIRCWSPLFANLNSNEVTPISISGFAFISPTGENIDKTKNIVVQLANDETIVLKEDSELGGATITLLKDETQIKWDDIKDKEDIRKCYSLPANYDAGSGPEVESKTFSIPVDSLKFNIKYYVNGSDEPVSINVVANLHYTSLTLNVPKQ